MIFVVGVTEPCYGDFHMQTVISIAGVVVEAAIAVGLFYLGGKMGTATVTSDQALAELQKFIADLTTAVQNAANEFSALLEAIKNNNGVNPGAIDGLVKSGEGLVANLQAAVDAAQQASNPTPPPAVSVSISPTSATLAPGAQQQFSASVTGASDTSVTWKAQSGSLDASGLYTAPGTTGTDSVTVTSNADPTQSASASITIA